jgi:hypothetical protein
MKLLYAGDTYCDLPWLKRLAIIGDQIHFTDRPAIMYGHFGTIGRASEMTGFVGRDEPVKIFVHQPFRESSDPRGMLYSPYIETDISNREFIKTFLDGLRLDKEFAIKFLKPAAQYGAGVSGEAIRLALLSDPQLLEPPNDIEIRNGGRLFRIDSVEARSETLKALLVEASIQVTNTLLIADEIEAAPMSDDLYFPRPLALRSANPKYIGGTAPLSPYLGLEFAKAVIPDELLQQLGMEDIFEYRNKSNNLYLAWSTDLNRLAAGIGDVEPARYEAEIGRLVATELAPKLVEYRNEMIDIRDALFGDLVKKVVAWEFPALSVAYFTDVGFWGAIAAFIGSGLRATTPALVDYVKAHRAVKRKHAVSYLIGLLR